MRTPRASALEYLDTLLAGTIRRRVMPLIDERRWPRRCGTPTACSRAGRAISTTRSRSSSTTKIRSSPRRLSMSSRERARWTALADDLEYIVDARHGAAGRARSRGVGARARAPRAAPPTAGQRRPSAGRRASPTGCATIPALRLRLDRRAVPRRGSWRARSATIPAATLRGRGRRRASVFPARRLRARHRRPAQSSAVVAAPADARLRGHARRPPPAADDRRRGRRHCDGRLGVELPDDALGQHRDGAGRVPDAARRRGVVERRSAVWENTSAEPDAPSRPLDSVEKALRLRQNPLLGQATVEQLLDLVAIAREVPLMPGRRWSTSATRRRCSTCCAAKCGDDGRRRGVDARIGQHDRRLAETLAGTAPHRRVHRDARRARAAGRSRRAVRRARGPHRSAAGRVQRRPGRGAATISSWRRISRRVAVGQLQERADATLRQKCIRRRIRDPGVVESRGAEPAARDESGVPGRGAREFLKKAKIVSAKDLGVGVTLPKKLTWR